MEEVNSQDLLSCGGESRIKKLILGQKKGKKLQSWNV